MKRVPAEAPGCHATRSRLADDAACLVRLGPAKTGYGNNWVIAAIVVKLPMVKRPVALPVLAKLVIKGRYASLRLSVAFKTSDGDGPDNA